MSCRFGSGTFEHCGRQQPFDSNVWLVIYLAILRDAKCMGDDDLWVMMTYEDHMMRQVSQVGSGQSGQLGPGRVRSGQVVSGLVRSGRVRYIRALWPTRHQTFGSNVWHMFVEFAKRSIFESYHSRLEWFRDGVERIFAMRIREACTR